MNAVTTGGTGRDELRRRLGDVMYRRRMALESRHAAQLMGQGRALFHWENIAAFRAVLSSILHATGLYERGRRNARAMSYREHCFSSARLPAAFDGFRILHLSDLHLDLDAGIVTAILARIHDAKYNIAVLTGDYRAEFAGDYQAVTREMARLVAAIRMPVFAVLGNHDSLDMAPAFEALGVRMLLNEQVSIERGGAEIYLAGVDDPHYYDTDDLDAALLGIPDGAFRILLSHTAELYREAAERGVDVMLCGHTHGGQICFPGGFHLLHSARHPRRFDRGFWRYHALQGYTSPGSGCCAVPVRFFCPPEITVHILRRE